MSCRSSISESNQDSAGVPLSFAYKVEKSIQLLIHSVPTTPWRMNRWVSPTNEWYKIWYWFIHPQMTGDTQLNLHLSHYIYRSTIYFQLTLMLYSRSLGWHEQFPLKWCKWILKRLERVQLPIYCANCSCACWSMSVLTNRSARTRTGAGWVNGHGTSHPKTTPKAASFKKRSSGKRSSTVLNGEIEIWVPPALFLSCNSRFCNRG